MTENADMPRYLRISVSKSLYVSKEPVNESFRLWQNGKRPQKRCYPERIGGIVHSPHVLGVSREFPPCMKLAKELVNPGTTANHFIDEAEVLSSRKSRITLYKRMLRLRKRVNKSQSQANGSAMKSPLGVPLLNRDAPIDPETVYSSEALRQFQNFHIREAEKPALRTFIRLAQKPVMLYDCINDAEKKMDRPSTAVEAFSASREK